MTILGIDPGTLRTGYGFIRVKGLQCTVVAFGTIDVSDQNPMAMRLRHIHSGIESLIKQFSPAALSIESAFYGKNVQAAFKIGLARGVAILAAAQNDIPVYEYAPRSIKKAVAGTGTATKEQVQYMIRRQLRISGKTKIGFDSSDALAAALCHFQSFSGSYDQSPKRTGKGRNRMRIPWEEFITNNPERVVNRS